MILMLIAMPVLRLKFQLHINKQNLVSKELCNLYNEHLLFIESWAAGAEKLLTKIAHESIKSII